MIVRRLINTGLVTLLLISFVSFQVNAQDKGLNITGSIKEGWKGLEGTKLTLTKNGSVDETFITTSNGKFEFFFEVNASYMLDVSKSGYVGKKIEFNTDVPDDFMLVLEFDFIVELFQDQSGLNKAIFSNPVAKIQYSKRHNEFDYDLDYTMEFQKQEEEVFRELEKLNEEKYLEEEQLRKDAEKLAKGQAKEILAAQKSEATAEKARLVEEQKQRKVAEAESSRIAQEALAEAKAEREAEEARIAEEERTKKEAEVALAKQEEEKKTVATDYKRLIKEAKSAEATQDYGEAKEIFADAARLKPEESEPEIRISAIDEVLERLTRERKEEDERNSKINTLLDEGIALQKTGSLEDAQAKYEDALNLDTANDEAIERIAEIAGILKGIQEEKNLLAKTENDFAQLLSDGGSLQSSSKFTEAKSKFEWALALGFDNTAAQKRIDEVLSQIKQQEEKQKEEQELTQRFESFYDKGVDLLAKGKLDQAKNQFTEASNIKPENQEPKDRIAEIEGQILAAAKQKEEEDKRSAELSALLALAKERFKLKDYPSALAAYQQLMELDPDNLEAGNKINEIEGILAKQEDEKRAAEELAKKVEEERLKAETEAAVQLEQERVAEEFRIKAKQELEAERLAAEEVKQVEEAEQTRLAELAQKEKEEQEALLAQQKADDEKRAAEESAKQEEDKRLQAEVKAASQLEQQRLAAEAQIEKE
ncbi:MAG: hypothetical protein ACI9EQ_000812, partial [Bacteroidia bacterium]